MINYHFSRLIRKHDVEPDHWLAAITATRPRYIEMFMDAVEKAERTDVYETLNALDEQIYALQSDQEIVAYRKGKDSPEYEAFTLSINFMNHLIRIFAQAGYQPGQHIPHAASY